MEKKEKAEFIKTITFEDDKLNDKYNNKILQTSLNEKVEFSEDI